MAAWTVGSLHVWPLIRARLAQDLLAAGRPSRETARSSRRLRHALGTVADRLRQPRLAPAPGRRSDVVILTRPANRQQVEGRWVDRLFDPLSDAFETSGWTTLHLEHRGDGTRYHTPRHRPAVPTRPPVTRRNLLAACRSLRGVRLEGFDRLALAVRGAHPAVALPSPVWVARRAASVEGAARFFQGLLAQASARLACCSVYYTLVGMAFCLAARRLGVPAVDVQHGVTLGNPAYEGWAAFPRDGYALLPSWFWCWSEADAGPVAAWPEPARRHHRTLAGGHPWMAFWTTTHPLVEGARDRLPPRAPGGLTVLVTLTWSSGFSDRLKRTILAAPSTWTFWVRTHPLMERERSDIRSWCARHAPGRAVVDAPSDVPLPLLLPGAGAHLTHNSSVVQEAARAGLPSVVMDTQALDVYPELRTGWAVFAEEPAAILEALRTCPDRALVLPRPAPYPSWTDLTSAVRLLMTIAPPCPATVAAASFRTRVPV